MAKLPFCIVSKSYSPPDHPAGPPAEGVRSLAKVVHSLGLPATWILDPAGARALAAELRDWHDQYGDEIAMALGGLPVEATAYRKRREELRKICAWSEVTISGQGGGKSETLLDALRGAGIQGHWGYCWEQTYVDGITDYGHSPGLFHVSPRSYKMPNPTGEGLVAIEWLSRDLNKAFWTGNPVHFAGEPDAFIVMGDWPVEECHRYFHHQVGQYLRNAKAGQVIPYIFQEEAEQLMERLGGVYAKRSPSLLEWIWQALAPLAGNDEIDFTTLPKLVQRFSAGEWPSPHLYRASDTKCRVLNDPRYAPPLRIYGAAFEFPEVLHYCSDRLFATYRAGSPTPLRLIRYDRQQPCDVSTPLEGETRLPILHSLERTGVTWRACVESTETSPFALCLPLEKNEAPPGDFPRNEMTWAWEFTARPGRHFYSPADSQ